MSNCELCGEPMPEGEAMFKFHGYSGPCPKPPLPEMTDKSLPPWEDPDVKIVYVALCNVGPPPGDEHWEGWAARHIVQALRRAHSDNQQLGETK